MKKHLERLLLSLIILTTFAMAKEFAPVGTAVAQFLEIGVGARAAGMGEAFTVVSNDASAVFWNPAALADAPRQNLFSAYSTWPAEIAFAGISYAMCLGRLGTLAFSGLYLMTGEMEETTIEQPDGTDEFFNLTNYAFGVSYSRYLTDRVSVGITTKLVHEDYLGYGYTTWALDLGTLYRTDFRGLRLGMSILHFAPEIKFSGEYIDYSDPLSVDANKPKKFDTYSLPMNFRFGVAMNLVDARYHKLVGAADMIHPNNNLEQYNLGLEYSFNKMVFVRSGYKLNSDEGGFTFGGGLRLGMGSAMALNVDYAYADLGVLKAAHRISFSLGL